MKSSATLSTRTPQKSNSYALIWLIYKTVAVEQTNWNLRL
jgi:hypothetical protein